MLARRPFGSLEAARQAAREEWFALPVSEWRTAFAHHPRIGDGGMRRAGAGGAAGVSAREQAGVANASADLLSALREANREYEARFGYIFIVCASGKTAAQMLETIHRRLANPPDREIAAAAAEHADICDRRLAGETDAQPPNG